MICHDLEHSNSTLCFCVHKFKVIIHKCLEFSSHAFLKNIPCPSSTFKLNRSCILVKETLPRQNCFFLNGTEVSQQTDEGSSYRGWIILAEPCWDQEWSNHIVCFTSLCETTNCTLPLLTIGSNVMVGNVILRKQGKNIVATKFVVQCHTHCTATLQTVLFSRATVVLGKDCCFGLFKG